MPQDQTQGASQATQASDATAKVKESAGPAVDRARDMTYSQIAAQKGRAADTIGGLAQALRQGGEAMQPQSGQLPVGSYANQAADQLENVARMLNEKDVQELIGEVESFARRQPAIFLGAAFTAGLLLSRFLKSSSRGASLADRAGEAAQSVVSQVKSDAEAEQRLSEPVAGLPAGGW